VIINSNFNEKLEDSSARSKSATKSPESSIHKSASKIRSKSAPK